jgi:hypothetical protein
MKKTLMQIFEENKLLDLPEMENLTKKIDALIKQDDNDKNRLGVSSTNN